MSDTAEAIAQARKAVEPDKPKHVLRTLGHSIREYKKASILARRGLRQEPAQGPVREGAGLQLHQY